MAEKTVPRRHPGGTWDHGRPHAPPPGTKGTVQYVDDMGQLGVRWDNGSSLSLIPGEDNFRKEAPKKSRDEVSR